MSLASYEVEGVYRSSVVVPSAEDRSPQEQRELFRPGLHGCPYCQARELSRMGDEYGEIAGWLYDASLTSNLHSEQREDVTKALYRAGLLSDGLLRKDLELTFRTTSRPYGPKRVKKRAGYNHLKGQGHLCAADDEHDVVLSLIRYRLSSDIKRVIPECRIEWLEDKRIDPSRRRPDLQAKVFVDQTLIEHLAVEIQKSSIPLETFQARHLILSKLATKAVWLFRKSGITRCFKDCIEWSLSHNVDIGSYEIDPSGDLVIDKILDLPRFSRSSSTLRTSFEGISTCNRLEALEEENKRNSVKQSISHSNKVKGDLSFIFSLSSNKHLYAPPDVDKDQENPVDSLEIFDLSLYSSYTGIPPWIDH